MSDATDAAATDDAYNVGDCNNAHPPTPEVLGTAPLSAPQPTLADVLRDIHCEEHIKIFEDHEIDLNTALLLEDEEIKQLFPKIGQRLKFKKKLEQLKNKVPQLLLSDFDRMFPGKGSKLFSKILLKKEEILKYARIKLKATRDKYVTNRLRELLSLVDDTKPETSTNIALMVLPLVINISPTRKLKKPTWKPSRAEISQGFISQAANEGEVTTSILEKTEKLMRLGRTLQPYVIFVGSSAVEITKAYVVINNTLYQFQKLITAVDCAFKVFQATGAYYPEESQDVWTAIQIGMYGITTRFDRKTQAVNVILADLELID